MRKKAWKITRRNQRNKLFKKVEKYIRLYKKALKDATYAIVDPSLHQDDQMERMDAALRTAEIYLDLMRQNGVILPGTIN